jgi:hypothetical protein
LPSVFFSSLPWAQPQPQPVPSFLSGSSNRLSFHPRKSNRLSSSSPQQHPSFSSSADEPQPQPSSSSSLGKALAKAASSSLAQILSEISLCSFVEVFELGHAFGQFVLAEDQGEFRAPLLGFLEHRAHFEGG